MSIVALVVGTLQQVVRYIHDFYVIVNVRVGWYFVVYNVLATEAASAINCLNP